MKLSLYFLAALFSNFGTHNTVFGQVLTSPVYKMENFRFDKGTFSEKLMPGKFKNNDEMNRNENLNFPHMKLQVLPKAELIGRNQDFDIYKLPLDQMFCLVPNEVYNQHMKAIHEIFNKSMGLETNDNMPNIFEKQEVIPLNKKSDF